MAWPGCRDEMQNKPPLDGATQPGPGCPVKPGAYGNHRSGDGRLVGCEGRGCGLGHRIQAFRILSDLTVADLAARLKVSEETITAWEEGTTEPSVHFICAMCEVFKTTPNGIFLGPSFHQSGPLNGMGGAHLETLSIDAQYAILYILRMSGRPPSNKEPLLP